MQECFLPEFEKKAADFVDYREKFKKPPVFAPDSRPHCDQFKA
jgi:hypothetical protein